MNIIVEHCLVCSIVVRKIKTFRLVDIILEKMSDASDDPSGNGQAANAYGNQPGAYNKGTTRLTANDQQAKGNACQC
jgi:hypothetical protein